MRLITTIAVFLALIAGSAAAQTQQTATAVFAGGCFWCMEPPFDKTDGVISTISGYTGGQKANPTYEEVSSGTTGHFESVKVEYDPAKVTYEQLLEVYWPNVDPFDSSGQFCDKGDQYRSAIFYGNEKEKELAEASKKQMAAKLGKPIETLILPAAQFYPAEDYHQDYYKKNPLKYKFYRYGCGRDARLAAVWGKHE
ncbi:MAG TPA: peptide-methionine (S)-S-oxide reductase MsrA [Hyphomicrobiales bacterium]|jgi:peptide-methionine (S)-S-oxide reductase